MMMFHVLKAFEIDEVSVNISKRGSGSLNRIYLAKTDDAEYVLQHINNKVFENPDLVAENVENIINYLEKNFGLSDYLIRTNNGKVNIKIFDSYWRCYKLKPTNGIFKKTINQDMYYEIGKLLGKFHFKMKDFPQEILHKIMQKSESVIDLFKKYVHMAEELKTQKTFYTWNEYKFIKDRIDKVICIYSSVENGNIPNRIIHNNLRLSNMVFSKESYESLELLGIDAVGVGTILSDFGDLVRYIASSAKEDMNELEFVKFRVDYFELITRGYLEQVKSFITKEEVNHLVDSVFLMTLKSGIEHLIQYVSEECFYKPDYETQHYDICRNQFKLVEDIESNIEEMKEIVNRIRNDLNI